MHNNRLHPSSLVPKQQLVPCSNPYSLPYYQFVSMEEPLEPPPLAYTGRAPAVFNGPFQIIEPGSDFYIETEPNFCLDLLPEEGLDTSTGDPFLSANGIPADLLEEAFRLENEFTLSERYLPVPERLSMAQYETQLVAEIERLFPDVKPRNTAKKTKNSRLAEELTRNSPVVIPAPSPVPSNGPCYMNVYLKGAGSGGGHWQNGNVPKSELLPARDAERGFQCVEMVDGNGAMFKAKYYAEQMTSTTTPTVYRQSSRPMTPLVRYSPVVTTTPSRLPQLKNLTPSMASKIESLANGMNRNVTLTPVRTQSRGSLVATSSSTIVIKAPKRTIASTTSSHSCPDPFFPMPIIKQEPLDETPPEVTEDPLNITESSTTPIEVPIIEPTPKLVATAASSSSKQPRKQKLVKLSQNGEVVFNESTNVLQARRQDAVVGKERKVVVPKTRATPANDYVTVTIQDIVGPRKTFSQRPLTPSRQPEAPQPLKPLPSPNPTKPLPAGKGGPSKHSASKRTRYRVHMTQHQVPQQQHRPGVSKRVPSVNQTIESIEILDSSDEDEEETTTAPESSEAEDVVVVLPKLPGNTESIQCPYCCRIFLSSQAVMEHAQHCADACLFRKASKQQKQPRSGQSLLKGNFPSTVATRRRSPEPPQPVATTTSKPKKTHPLSASTSSSSSTTPMATKRSERLSIEILPSAFNIDNLLLCKICQKSFRTTEHLQQHQRIHQTPIVCEYCQKKFYETPPPKHVCQEKKRSMKLKRTSS